MTPPTAGVLAREETGQQPCLSHGGVLVLVEQHHPEPVSLGRPDLGARLGEARTESHLVGEVHDSEASLQVAVAVDEVEHLSSLFESGDRLAGLVRLPGCSPPLLLRHLEDPHLVRRDQVFRHLCVEVQKGIDVRRHPGGQVLDWALVCADRSGR